MKQLLLAPFLLGFISPAIAEVDEKAWLRSPGSTSEWLETKNWDDNEWWRETLASYAQFPKRMVHQELIDVSKVKTCNQFIQLYDIPNKLKDSCRNLYKNLSKRSKKKVYINDMMKSFYEDKPWNGDEWSDLRKEMKKDDFNLFLEALNIDYKFKKGFFNDDFWIDFLYKRTGYPPSEKDILVARLTLCQTKLKEEGEIPTLGMYRYCSDEIQKLKALKLSKPINRKDSKPSIENKSNQQLHETCLNAADYAGCMRYQNK